MSETAAFPAPSRLLRKILGLGRGAIRNHPWAEKFLGSVSPIFPGASFLCKFLPPPETYPAGTLRTCQRHGLRWELDLSQWVDWHVFFGQEGEEDRRFLRLIRSGDHVLDGGAYIGTLALRAAIRAGPTGRVHGFEPAAGNYQRLCRHVEINRIQNIRCYPNALAETTGALELARPWPENNSGNLVNRGSWNGCPVEKISGLALDDWMEQAEIQRLDVLKLDVEGCEIRALRGAQKTIAKFRPRLFLEAHDPNLARQGGGRQELRELVQSLGYQIQVFCAPVEHLICQPQETNKRPERENHP